MFWGTGGGGLLCYTRYVKYDWDKRQGRPLQNRTRVIRDRLPGIGVEHFYAVVKRVTPSELNSHFNLELVWHIFVRLEEKRRVCSGSSLLRRWYRGWYRRADMLSSHKREG